MNEKVGTYMWYKCSDLLQCKISCWNTNLGYSPYDLDFYFNILPYKIHHIQSKHIFSIDTFTDLDNLLKFIINQILMV